MTKMSKSISFEQANLMIQHAFNKGLELGLAPLTTMVLVAGGALVKRDRSETLGAVGITGDTSDYDEVCAVAGIEAVGLMADCGN